MAGSYLFDVGHLTPISGGDIQASSVDPKFTPGAFAFMRDQMGPKYMKYIRNRTASTFAQGALVSKLGDTSGQTAKTTSTGSKTHVVPTVDFTADDHEGAILYVLDNDATAGAAPEAEAALIVRNSATRAEFDPDYPLSVALASAMTLLVLATYGAELSADGDFNYTVLGVVLPSTGILTKEYGWVQQFGRCRAQIKASTGYSGSGTTPVTQISADTGKCGTVGTDQANLVVGRAMIVLTSDIVSDLGWVQMSCDDFATGFIAVAAA